MFYRDYGSLGEEYFEGNSADEIHPAGYSQYQTDDTQQYDAYASLVCDLLERVDLSPTTATILLTGCAYGYTIEHLVDRGVDAWGMDLSDFALEQASASIQDRLVQGNGGSYEDLQRAADTAGVDGFDAVIEMGTLCYFTDEGAVKACRGMRAISPVVIHRVRTADDLEGKAAEWYNTKSLDEWRELCDPYDLDIWVENAEFQRRRQEMYE